MSSPEPEIEYANNARDVNLHVAVEQRNARHETIAQATGLPLGTVKRLAAEHRLGELYDEMGRLRQASSSEARRAWLTEHRFAPIPSDGDPQAARDWLELRRHTPAPIHDPSARLVWLEMNK